MMKHPFTLLELLITVGIVAILAGLLFPATNLVREAARRLSFLPPDTGNGN